MSVVYGKTAESKPGTASSRATDASYDVRAQWRTASPTPQPCLSVDVKRKGARTRDEFEIEACVPVTAGSRTVVGTLRQPDGRETEVAVLR